MDLDIKQALKERVKNISSEARKVKNISSTARKVKNWQNILGSSSHQQSDSVKQAAERLKQYEQGYQGYQKSDSVKQAEERLKQYDQGYQGYQQSDAVKQAAERLKQYEQQGYQGYQESDTVKQAVELLKQHVANRPASYSSKHQSQIDDIVSRIVNREPFQYDVNGDALYQQYKDRYIYNGQRAMQDTMGQAAALTGGYGSSYAQMVGQQAYNEYMMGLNDVIPELQQLALDKYDRETARLQDQYSLYSDLDERAYSKWQDEQNIYNAELQRLTDDARYQAEQDYDKWKDGKTAYYDELKRLTDDAHYKAEQDYDKWKDGKTAYYDELKRLTDDAHYKAEQDWDLYAVGYEDYKNKVKESQEAAEAAAKKAAEDEAAAKLEKYKFAGPGEETGDYRYYLGDKEYTYAKGINPHSGSINPDIAKGTFGAGGYQPDNIGGEKLSPTEQTAFINGHEQNVWMKPDGTLWMWDDTVNRYVEYNNFVEVDTDATRSFISGVLSAREFGSRNRGEDAPYKSYNEYLEAEIDEWLTEGKLNDTEAATLMVRYGLV